MIAQGRGKVERVNIVFSAYSLQVLAYVIIFTLFANIVSMLNAKQRILK